MANVILKEYLAQTNYICEITDAVYIMGRNIQERMGIKKKDYQRNNKTSGNRRVQKIQKQLKDKRIMAAQIANEIYCRKMRRKATRKEKKILRQLKIKAENQLKSSESLVNVKEKWAESLQMLKVKLIKTWTRDARIRNNQMFEEDEGNFFRNAANKKEYKGTVPSIDRFVTFWDGIWEDDTKTLK